MFTPNSTAGNRTAGNRTAAYSIVTICLFGFAAVASTIKQPLFKGRMEKTNKSELWNRLTYRILTYIFEVRIKTFYLK